MSVVCYTSPESICILSFLESYKTCCDHTHVNEGLAIQILPYILEGGPKQTFFAHILHRVVSYPKVINVLLDKYTSNEKIIQTQDAIKNLRKLHSQRASDFGDYIRSRTKRCGSAYGPIKQIEIFIHGIGRKIREHTNRYCSYHPDIDLESLVRFASALHYADGPDAKDKTSNSNLGYHSNYSKSTCTTPVYSNQVEDAVLTIRHNKQ